LASETLALQSVASFFRNLRSDAGTSFFKASLKIKSKVK
jgi:hypothetical protein